MAVEIEPTKEIPLPYTEAAQRPDDFKETLEVTANTVTALEQLGAPPEIEADDALKTAELLKAAIKKQDPKALNNAKHDLRGLDNDISYVEDPYEAAAGADALAVITEWDLYKNLDYEKIFKSMNQPAFLFDGRNILDHRKLFDIGFNVYPIGKPPLTHF